jgi:hypothetical protein
MGGRRATTGVVAARNEPTADKGACMFRMRNPAETTRYAARLAPITVGAARPNMVGELVKLTGNVEDPLRIPAVMKGFGKKAAWKFPAESDTSGTVDLQRYVTVDTG